MPKFTADSHLAALTQRAAQVLRRLNQAALPSGMTTPMPGASPLGPIKSLRDANRVSQMQGSATRMNPNLVAALKIPHLQAQSRDAIYAAAAARAARAAGGGGDQFSQADFERGNLEFAGQLGMSGEQALAAAQAHAPSYGGVRFRPHNIAQEGHVEYRNGTPGIMVKFSAPGQGSSTEWVPLG